MGGSSWSDDFYKARVDTKKSTGTPIFAYDADVKGGVVAAKAHEKLDPKGVIREARDSTAHPKSKPIIVAFDQTGSMSTVPPRLQAKLPQLMGLLLRKNYVQDPQILFACFGDYHNREQAPLQVGQFESGVEMDDDLTRFYLEAKGGGSREESYEALLYFAARKTSCDAFEKRGEKGYLFLVGDEMPYPRLTIKEAEDIFGDHLQADIPVEELVKEASEKLEIFFLIPQGAAHAGAAWLAERWKGLVSPQHVITIEPDLICEAIGGIIGLLEGTVAASADALVSDLTAAGVGADAARIVSVAVDPLTKALVHVGTGVLPEVADRSTAVERL